MSANLVVDLGATCDFRTSVSVGSGSNLAVGQIVDLLNANTFCNVYVSTDAGSGTVELRVQTSPDTLSGNFTDPTSGLAQLPTSFCSGGVVFFNSGLWSSGNMSDSANINNAPLFCSGGVDFAAFQRPARYARLVYNSGPFPSWITAGFISNKKTTGSGGGYSPLPSSGAVQV